MVTTSGHPQKYLPKCWLLYKEPSFYTALFVKNLFNTKPFLLTMHILCETTHIPLNHMDEWQTDTVEWGNFGRWGNFGQYKTFILTNIFATWRTIWWWTWMLKVICNLKFVSKGVSLDCTQWWVNYNGFNECKSELSFLAATKQLYDWFSPSVCPPVCLSVTPSQRSTTNLKSYCSVEGY